MRSSSCPLSPASAVAMAASIIESSDVFASGPDVCCSLASGSKVLPASGLTPSPSPPQAIAEALPSSTSSHRSFRKGPEPPSQALERVSIFTGNSSVRPKVMVDEQGDFRSRRVDLSCPRDRHFPWPLDRVPRDR